MSAAEASGDTAYREAAAAQRHLGALAFLNDTSRALAAYEHAARLDPEHLETWFQLGQVRQYAGQLRDAQLAFEQALALSEAAGNEREASRANTHLGDMRGAQGDLAGALSAYQQGLAIAERLASADPSNTQWQRDLSISHEKIGDVRRAQGDLAGALSAYQQGLAIRERLATADPSHTGWQRNVSVSHNRIGDVRSAQGDLAGALSAYQQDLAIAERLASADPSNTEWRTDVVVSCWKLAATLQEMPGRTADARGYLERGLAILTSLQERSLLAPSKAGWIGTFEMALDDLNGGN